MKTNTLLSSVAAFALILAAGPAAAVSLNIGGDDGLVSVDSDSGGSDSGGVSVGVGSGDDGGLDVDADVDGLLGGDGEGGTGVLGDKPLLDTGGDGLVTLDTEDNEDALVTLFGDGEGELLGDELVEGELAEAEVLEEDRDEEVFLRLFGSGDAGTTATADLGGDGEPVEVELSGTGGTPGDELADVELLGDDASTAEVTLFGSDDNGTGDGAGSGDTADSGDDGSGGGDGGDGTGVDETTTASTGATAPAPATRVAARSQSAAGDDCFSPNQTQIDHLLGRSSYEPGDAEAWQQAARLDIVPVQICADAASRLQAAIAADDNMALLQSAVAADARLSAEVAAEDVLAVDQAGEELTVYVY